MNIITNNRPRPVLNGWELSATERAEFDCLDWEAIEAGDGIASFVRYKGQLIDLNDMERGLGGSPMPEAFKGWDNYLTDSFFSGIVVRYIGEDCEDVVVGRFYS